MKSDLPRRAVGPAAGLARRLALLVLAGALLLGLGVAVGGCGAGRRAGNPPMREAVTLSAPGTIPRVGPAPVRFTSGQEAREPIPPGVRAVQVTRARRGHRPTLSTLITSPEKTRIVIAMID
ncbi:MAG: hypothetical protein ACRDK7_11095, partial [Solirubrobacteraceae bacterium]